ncbi:hypothetical protein A0H81_08353 [Grifola frondosa]|uniref:Uncharacterized protein n=1 Tax=Grifola frondosa TaxID=5627 RepID=A0A1C7M3E2_GRIFR|nr:hypothetical protein A0H81_08353 [Grifola frondosa]
MSACKETAGLPMDIEVFIESKNALLINNIKDLNTIEINSMGIFTDKDKGFFFEFLPQSYIDLELELGHENGLHNVLLIVEQAKHELSQIFITSKVLPDKFSASCKAL